jgi:hypothetical protein
MLPEIVREWIEKADEDYGFACAGIELKRTGWRIFAGGGIEVIKTTIPACLDILSHNLFVKNKIDTGFVERNF